MVKVLNKLPHNFCIVVNEGMYKNMVHLATNMLFKDVFLFGPYRSHFLSRKSLIAAKNETKEKMWKEEKETLKWYA